MLLIEIFIINKNDLSPTKSHFYSIILFNFFPHHMNMRGSILFTKQINWKKSLHFFITIRTKNALICFSFERKCSEQQHQVAAFCKINWISKLLYEIFAAFTLNIPLILLSIFVYEIINFEIKDSFVGHHVGFLTTNENKLE